MDQASKRQINQLIFIKIFFNALLEDIYNNHRLISSYSFKYIILSYMSQLSYSPLQKNQQTHQNLQQTRVQEQSIRKTSSSCWIHVIYLILIAILFWYVAKLYEQQINIEQADIKGKKDIIQMQNQITKQLQRQQQLINQKQKQLIKRIQANQVKANYNHQMTMEQHYMNKVQHFREFAKNQQFLKDVPKAKASYLLALNNFKLIHQNIYIKRQIQQLLRNQYQRLSKIYDFSLPQKSFCIVVPTFNNGKDFRYQYNLRSIFNQNYTNYKLVIIDDASNDQNYQLISQYLQNNHIPQKVHLIKNKERTTALPNIYKAATEYCQPQDILALVDGDDQLLGINVLKVFNSLYTQKNLEVLYSNLIINEKNGVKKGWSSGYSDQQKKKNIYRDGSTRMFPLRTFKVSTFLKINVKDFKQDSGQWFRSAYDQTICPQVLQLSCGKNDYVDQFFYLYNFGIGTNDMEVNSVLNSFIISRIRGRKKYECPAK